jgi:hypothetical protein
MNKRGISHIEVLLSFLIFIGFVIFALYFFSPIKTSRLVESSTSYAFNEIIEVSSVEVEIYSASLTGLSPVVEVTLPSSLVNANARVENYLGVELPSSKQGDTICFEGTNAGYGSGGDGFVTIKLSEDLEPNIPGASCPGVASYTLASSSSNKVLSEKRVLELKTSYDGNYVALKQSFNLPGRVEFGFLVEFDDGRTINAMRGRQSNVEIFSDMERIEILSVSGNVEFADLTVEIW